MNENDEKKMKIAEKLKNARAKTGMTQAQVAKILGMTAQAISNFELGKNNVSSDIIVKMSKVYGIDYKDILDDPEHPEYASVFEKSEQDISRSDRMHIQRYLKLDAHGKEIVNATIDIEYKRIVETPKRFVVKQTAEEDEMERYMKIPFAARGGGLQKSNEKRARHMKKLEEHFKNKGD